MKYDEEIVSRICQLIKDGLPAKHASLASDIDESTYYDWLKKYPQFQALIKKAESERLATLLNSIRNDQSWQSKAWLCEKLYRDELGPVSEMVLLDRITKLENILEELKREKHL